MANRLESQTSPYLLQHKDNPVAWEPWDDQALSRARDENKPLLVSIGYSSCHWCHVMERESFEDPETATYMNEHFVPIKVDREERPDVDSVYMQAVQGMTGQGGWPLNVFCDPEGVPFFGGTYFPPAPRQGMPSFRQVLEAVSQAWDTRSDEIRSAAPRTRQQLAGPSLQPSQEILSPAVLDEAERTLAAQFDATHGGFGGAPKFPPSCALEFLLARVASGQGSQRTMDMIDTTLERMAKGGIYDQVGGGFARYSVDGEWLVPHFEKMLYDNALLAACYLRAWEVIGSPLYRHVCEETLDWALREMHGPEGGFYSALDADSEGEEGRFYVWTPDELRDLLGDDAEALMRHWGADLGPNFEGRCILYVADEDAVYPELLARGRRVLYDARSQRVWPGLDDKRLTAWNALMVSALAQAGATLERDDYIDAARTCSSFILETLRDEQGRLLRTYKDGRASIPAYLEDYAFLVEALLALYEATFETRWFRAARELASEITERFSDRGGAGFFTTPTEQTDLIVRPKSFEDHPIPSGNSSAAEGCLRLATYTGEASLEEPAEGLFRALHQPAARHPQAFGKLLEAMHFYFGPRREVALVGDDLSALAEAVRSRYRPLVVVAGARPGDSDAAEAIPLLRDRDPVDGQAAAYVCENFACRLPVTDPGELERQLDAPG